MPSFKMKRGLALVLISIVCNLGFILFMTSSMQSGGTTQYVARQRERHPLFSPDDEEDLSVVGSNPSGISGMLSSILSGLPEDSTIGRLSLHSLSWLGEKISAHFSWKDEQAAHLQEVHNGQHLYTTTTDSKDMMEEKQMREYVEQSEREKGYRFEEMRSALNRASTLACKRQIAAAGLRYHLLDRHNTSASGPSVIDFSDEPWNTDHRYWEDRIAAERPKYMPLFNLTQLPVDQILQAQVQAGASEVRYGSGGGEGNHGNIVGGGGVVDGGAGGVLARPPKLRIGFVILVHSISLQIELLMQALYHPDHFYVLHVDAQARPLFAKNMAHLVEGYHSVGKNVWLVPEHKRQAVTWAGYSMIAAQWAGIETLFEKAGDHWDYCINLSGADFPMKPVSYMAEYLARHYPFNYVEIFPQHMVTHELFAFAECDRHVFKVAPRPLPKGLNLRRGSQWFALTRVVLEWLMTGPAFPRLNNFFGESIFSDEAYLPTILSVGPFKELMRFRLHCLVWGTDDLHKSKCRHIDEADWCGRGPINVEKERAFVFMDNPHCFFARKFDIDSRWDVLKVVDERLKEMQWRAGFQRISPYAAAYG